MSTTMDTINNFATAAAKAVWGENQQGEEPVSGKAGDVSKGEPYDAGNMEPTENNEYTTSSAKQAKTTGTAAEGDDVPRTISAEQKTKSAAKGDSTKDQNDIRDPEDPKTHPKNAPTDVDDKEDGMAEPQKLDGPGPKPIEEVAKEHGGDAGASGESVERAGKESEGANQEESEINKKSTGEGTGEQYVKSTGLNADGGDFDVTKPGAGREADRLLEEKGVHRADEKEPKQSPGSSPSPNGRETKEKKSLKDKIKEKLHR